MMLKIMVLRHRTSMIALFRLDIWDPEDLSAAVDGVVAHDELINAVSGSAKGGRIATGSRDGRVSFSLNIFVLNFSLAFKPYFYNFSDLMTKYDNFIDKSVGQEEACSKCGEH